jgi:hypothetical protein
MDLNVESDQTLLLAVADEPRVFFSGAHFALRGRNSRKCGIFVAAASALSSEMQYPHAADLKAATLNFTV